MTPRLTPAQYKALKAWTVDTWATRPNQVDNVLWLCGDVFLSDDAMIDLRKKTIVGERYRFGRFMGMEKVEGFCDEAIKQYEEEHGISNQD